MNRTELAKNVATELGVSQAEGARAVDAVLSNIVMAIQHDPEGARVGGFWLLHGAEKTGAARPQPAHRRDNRDTGRRGGQVQAGR